jgi:hypothetical protein
VDQDRGASAQSHGRFLLRQAVSSMITLPILLYCSAYVRNVGICMLCRMRPHPVLSLLLSWILSAPHHKVALQTEMQGQSGVSTTVMQVRRQGLMYLRESENI